MRYLFTLLMALLLTACGAGSPDTGRPFSLQDLQGHWVVVNYWAKWCTPCIKEIPELNQLAANFPDLRVVGVNYDGATGDELAAQLESLDVQFPTLPDDPSAQLGIPRPAVLPTTLIIDPMGKLVDTLVGPQTVESLSRATGQTDS